DVLYARRIRALLDEAGSEAPELRRHDTLETALDDLRTRGADCVLLDLAVPGALGLEAVAAVLNAEPGIPVIVLGDHDDDDLAITATRAGAQDSLVKGREDAATLGRAIAFAVERRRAAERNEDLLRANEDRWRTLTHLAPVGIVETGADGQCVFANDWVSE